MAIDMTVTLGNVLTIIGMAVAGAGAYYFQRARVDVQDQRLHDLQMRHEETFAIARKVRDDLAAHRLEVVENFVKHPSMEKVEGRLLAAIDRLTSEIAALRSEFRKVLERE